LSCQAKLYNVHVIDGQRYWSPFEKFCASQNDLLQGWLVHYERLGIRTMVRRRKLLVNLEDDLRVYHRKIE
jgi:hypothetical protein